MSMVLEERLTNLLIDNEQSAETKHSTRHPSALGFEALLSVWLGIAKVLDQVGPALASDPLLDVVSDATLGHSNLDYLNISTS